MSLTVWRQLEKPKPDAYCCVLYETCLLSLTKSLYIYKLKHTHQ